MSYPALCSLLYVSSTVSSTTRRNTASLSALSVSETVRDTSEPFSPKVTTLPFTPADTVPSLKKARTPPTPYSALSQLPASATAAANNIVFNILFINIHFYLKLSFLSGNKILRSHDIHIVTGRVLLLDAFPQPFVHRCIVPLVAELVRTESAFAESVGRLPIGHAQI